MKRVIAFLLSAALLASLISALPVHAAGTNQLIANGGFEEADLSQLVSGTFSRVTQDTNLTKVKPAAGSYMLKVTDGEVQWDIGDDFGVYQQIQNGSYKLDFTASLKVYSRTNTTLRFHIKYLRRGESCAAFLDGGTVSVSSGQWKDVTFTKPLYGAPNENVVYAYLVVSAGTTVFLDDVSVTHTGTPTGKTRPADVPVGSGAPTGPLTVDASKRSTFTTVGAVRWDAWYGHDTTVTSVAHVVEETLSSYGGAFLSRAPFFAGIENGKVVLPKYSQEICDAELAYAESAGIDYFIYGWYDDGMRAARAFHITSPYRDRVKMAIIASGSRFEHIEMARMLKENYYMKVLGNRPLIFINTNSADTVASIVTYYRNLCLQLKNEGADIGYPFVTVYYNNMSDVPNIKALYAAGADAITNYAFEGTGTVSSPGSYAALAAKAEQNWTDRENRVYDPSTQQIVPCVTLGYDLSPRYRAEQTTPGIVHWMGVPSSGYAAKATPQELGEHVAAALAYMADPSNAAYTGANTISVYAWNEHDEGGWLCPTIRVNGNGEQMFDGSGMPLINTERLDAVGAAIRAVRPDPAEESAILGAALAVGETLSVNYYAQIPEYAENRKMVFTRQTGLTEQERNLLEKPVSVFTNGVTQNDTLQYINDAHIKAKAVSNGKLAVTYYPYASAYTSPIWQLGRYLREAAASYQADRYRFDISMTVDGGLTQASMVLRQAGSASDQDMLTLSPARAITGETTFCGSFELTQAACLAAGDSWYGLCLDALLIPGETTVTFDDVILTATPIFEDDGTFDTDRGLWRFEYPGINPQCMTDTVLAELYVNGTLEDVHEAYSVRTYCMNQYDKTAEQLHLSPEKHTELRKLLAALLNFGAEAQKYTGYKTVSPANEGLSRWREMTAEKPVSVKEKTVLAPSDSSLNGAGLHFRNTVSLYFTVNDPSATATRLVLSVNGREKAYDLTAYPAVNGKKTVYTDPVMPDAFGTPVTVTLFEGGTAVQKVRYSVGSYASSHWNSAADGVFLRALTAYGQAVNAFVNGTSGSFDSGLSQEDPF